VAAGLSVVLAVLRPSRSRMRPERAPAELEQAEVEAA
jgi:hypothetical protein